MSAHAPYTEWHTEPAPKPLMLHHKPRQLVGPYRRPQKRRPVRTAAWQRELMFAGLMVVVAFAAVVA